MSVQQANKSALGNPGTLGEAARQQGYRLRKEFKALMGDLIANSWEGEWTDSQTGVKMAGHGVEIWTMRGGRIAGWDAAFNFKQAGKTSAMGII
jgi:nuclear transport factor 2 (NTF2) superfamily protein